MGRDPYVRELPCGGLSVEPFRIKQSGRPATAFIALPRQLVREGLIVRVKGRAITVIALLAGHGPDSVARAGGVASTAPAQEFGLEHRQQDEENDAREHHANRPAGVPYALFRLRPCPRGPISAVSRRRQPCDRKYVEDGRLRQMHWPLAEATTADLELVGSRPKWWAAGYWEAKPLKGPLDPPRPSIAGQSRLPLTRH